MSDDLPGQLAFDCEYVRDIAIVPFRPKVAVRSRFDQLSADAHPAAGTLHAAFQHVRYAKRLGDLAQITLYTDFVLHCRRAANDFQVGYFRQASQDFVLHAICEVSVLFFAAQVFEGKHGDALFGNRSRRATSYCPGSGHCGRWP